MPGTGALRGDIYNAKPDAVVGGDAHLGPRRMVCVAELPHDQFAWRAMSRTTTAQDEAVDLFSPRDEQLGLSMDGWWSHRFIRSVKKRWTGHPTECAYLATLGEPARSEVLDHYKNRPKPGASI